MFLYMHPTMMWLLLLSFWVIVISSNLYVGYVQVRLFQKGLLDSRWRLGSSILKSALQLATERNDIRMIRRATIMFNVSIVAFLGFLGGIAAMATV